MEEGVIEGSSLDADPNPPRGARQGLQGIGFVLGRELDGGFAAGFGSSGRGLTHHTLETARLTR